jgi:hypothetical protein
MGFEIRPWFERIDCADREGEEVLKRLVGATIVRIGEPDEDRSSGPAIAIEYVPPGETVPQLVVFAVSEIGIWLEDLSTRSR